MVIDGTSFITLPHSFLFFFSTSAYPAIYFLDRVIRIRTRPRSSVFLYPRITASFPFHPSGALEDTHTIGRSNGNEVTTGKFYRKPSRTGCLPLSPLVHYSLRLPPFAFFSRVCQGVRETKAVAASIKGEKGVELRGGRETVRGLSSARRLFG